MSEMKPQEKPEMMQLTRPERSRTYHYRDGRQLKIEGVAAVCVRPSGTHRLNAKGRLWIVAPGWDAIEIDADDWTF